MRVLPVTFFTLGDLALAGLAPAVAVGPALLSFAAAAALLIRRAPRL